MKPTSLRYLCEQELLEAQSEVQDVLSEGDKQVVILDETIFYPQGGGQPCDTGIIKSSSGEFIVEQVRFEDGLVKHKGTFSSGSFKPGQKVICIVDKDRRKMLSRLHSAGHLIDRCVKELGFKWKETKGYHFSEGAYVEYQGSLESVDKEQLKKDIEDCAQKHIKKDLPIDIKIVSKDELLQFCSSIPDYIPADKPIRIVGFDDFYVPCGGTHVPTIADIKRIEIRKIKTKGPIIRVCYSIEDNNC